MKSVRLFDLIQFDGASWQVVAQDGPVLALKNLSTYRIRKVAVADLLSDDSYLPDPPDRLPNLDDVAVLETLDSDSRARVEFLHRHVVEVLTGTPPGNGEPVTEPKPEYSSVRLLRDRVQAKVAELGAAGTPISERTLKRHIAAYRRGGVAGLVDGRRIKEASPTGRVDPRVVALLEEALAKQQRLSTGTRSRLISQVALEARRRDLPVPSQATLYRVVANLEGARHPFGNATTRRTQANRPDRTYGRQAPSRPGELVEIDSSPLDLMVIYPDGATGRADLTLALDVATRTILAAILRPVATKSVDAAVLLARAMTPLPMQPGWDASLAFSRSVLPQGMVQAEDEIRARISAKPVIVPETITIDRSKVFVGSTFLNACERLQISVTKAAPRTPTDKPHIERVFASINSGFTQYLAGYTGPNVVRRGRDPAGEARYTLNEVQNLLDLWIVATWQNRAHSGLRHPALPRRDLTPNEMFAALAGVAPQVNVTLSRDDYIALLPLQYRSIQPYGINFEGLHYDSPDLHEYRGVKSGLPAPALGRWEVRFDPYRLQSIYVRDHRRGRWIEAEWTLARQTLAPFSFDVLRAAKQALAHRGSVPAVDVLAEINRIQTSLTSDRVREHVAARRNATTDPVVPPADLPEDEPGRTTLAPGAGPLEGSDTPRGRPRRKARRIDQE
ncbi:Mu transposase C-terminal domain-containing protein [Geodermatophilus sp. SYSU D00703]